MGTSQKYSLDELLNLYSSKAESLGRPPTAVEIDSDPAMPAYATFKRRIGGRDILCSEAQIELNNTLEKPRINNQFCNDCVKDPRNCNKEIEECQSEAELYYRMLEN